MKLHSKLPEVGTTIFTIMTQLANEHQAINLAQGFPGFDTYPFLKDLVSQYMSEGQNQYAPMSGVPALKTRLAEKTLAMYGVDFDAADEVTIVSGATEALYAAITAVVRSGDEVIVLEPAYDSYVPAIRLNGGIPVFVSLNPVDFSVDWDKVKDAISDKTRLMVINTPHNPCGYVWTKEDLDTLAGLLEDKEIFLVSDEVYEHIVFDEKQHLPVFSHPLLKERTFACGSFGKTFHVTGWKIGFCLAPKPLMEEFRKIHQYLTFSTVTPMQYALAEFMLEPSRYLFLGEFYQRKRDLFLKGLRQTPFEFSPAEGSFFQVVSYKHLSQEGDFDLAVRMIKSLGVASIPVSSFYHDKRDEKLLRFCFAKDDEVLLEAIERLKKIGF